MGKGVVIEWGCPRKPVNAAGNNNAFRIEDERLFAEERQRRREGALAGV